MKRSTAGCYNMNIMSADQTNISSFSLHSQSVSTSMESMTNSLQTMMTSKSAGVTDTGTAELHRFYYVIIGLVATSVCCVGLIANLLNILIYSSLIKYSQTVTVTNYFLLCIAVTDQFVLVIYLTYSIACVLLPYQPLISEQDITASHPGTASYYVFYTWYIPANAFVIMSNWCMVSVMVFRFIAVYFPLKAYCWCNVTRAKLVLTIIIIVSVISVIPECFTLSLELFDGYGYIFLYTNLHSQSGFTDVYYPYLHTISCILPFGICAFLSTLLIRSLSRRGMALYYDSARRFSSHCPSWSLVQRRISIMLLVIVMWFLTCTSPSLVWRLLNYGLSSSVLSYTDWVKLRATADLFLVLQHSANFAAYLLTNAKFRFHARYYLTRARPSLRSLRRQRTISTHQQQSSHYVQSPRAVNSDPTARHIHPEERFDMRPLMNATPGTSDRSEE